METEPFSTYKLTTVLCPLLLHHRFSTFLEAKRVTKVFGGVARKLCAFKCDRFVRLREAYLHYIHTDLIFSYVFNNMKLMIDLNKYNVEIITYRRLYEFSPASDIIW